MSAICVEYALFIQTVHTFLLLKWWLCSVITKRQLAQWRVIAVFCQGVDFGWSHYDDGDDYYYG